VVVVSSALLLSAFDDDELLLHPESAIQSAAHATTINDDFFIRIAPFVFETFCITPCWSVLNIEQEFGCSWE
jgi:hypothetical protein